MYTPEKQTTRPCHPPSCLVSSRLACLFLCWPSALSLNCVLCTLAIYRPVVVRKRGGFSPPGPLSLSRMCVCCLGPLVSCGQCVDGLLYEALDGLHVHLSARGTTLGLVTTLIPDHTHTTDTERESQGHAHHTHRAASLPCACMHVLLVCEWCFLLPEEWQSEVSCLVAELV